ncbi:MAG: hypothetical protein H7338_23230 [Candidatus Sericytochromatia bacterium]|nr:hypothetical protein [Candidatus Sericytochromatia bacterium]
MMDHTGPIEFWTPNRRLDNASSETESLDLAMQAVTHLPRPEARRMVDQLIRLGQFYEAARCLELMAQHSLGVITRAERLVDRRRPEFGRFHDDIRALMQAGELYHRSRRPGTGWATFQRALIFVEEALRSLESVEVDDPADSCCVGLAFELAGHCCAAIDKVDGLDYYRAAQDCWRQSTVVNPEACLTWQAHHVTQTVIASLEPVVAIKPLEPSLRISLFSTDYQTRLDTAKALLC